VVLAARGARETSDGIQTIQDASVVQQLKSQASRVYREALAIAILVTAVIMLARGLININLPPVFFPD
jgi:hypothetical protein